MGDGHDRKVSNEEAQAAMQPVQAPLPKPSTPKPTVKVDTERAPTVDEILDPKRPSMDDAESVVVVDSITRLVEKIFHDVLMPLLEALKPQLAAVPPPPHESQFGLQLLSWMVEIVATTTVGEVGGIAAKGLIGAASSFAKPAADGISTVSKAAGKEAGDLTREKLQPNAPERAEPGSLESPARPGMPLVDEFIQRQKLALLGKEQAAEDTLRLVKRSAAHIPATDLAQLDSKLLSLLSGPELSGWFSHKVTLEWLNFMARLSLGPRPQGQATNMAGANTIGGFHEAGTRGLVQWRGTHDGFVDITVAAESGTAVSLVSASVSGRPGAADVLKTLKVDVDAAGTNYTLATIPLFRRVWIKTGDSAFMTNPAVVLTPEGALEVNYDDPTLATLGGAKAERDVWSTEPFDDSQRRDPGAWSKRADRASHAMAGAQRIVALLSTQSTERLQ